MLRTQFKMELLVYAQDRTYNSSWSDCKREENEEKDRLGHSPVSDQSSLYSMDSHATLQELMLHLKSYYKVRFSLEGWFMNKSNDSKISTEGMFFNNGFPFFFLLQIASQRLADQIPLVIRYQMLQESAMQLQREMLQVLQDKENVEFLLKEDFDIGTKRAALQSRLKRLSQARTYLVEF